MWFDAPMSKIHHRESQMPPSARTAMTLSSTSSMYHPLYAMAATDLVTGANDLISPATSSIATIIDSKDGIVS
jgi:hypothetical protein